MEQKEKVHKDPHRDKGYLGGEKDVGHLSGNTSGQKKNSGTRPIEY